MRCARADVASVPATLKVIGEVAAGRPFDRRGRPGEAVRIFTGGVLPRGADTVVIQENTERDGDAVVVEHAGRRAGSNVRARGLDFAQGDVAAAQGPPPHRPRPGARRGDEPSRPCRCAAGRRSRSWRPATNWCRRAPSPAPAQIVYSNGFALAALARREGAEVIDLGIVPGPARRHDRRRPPGARGRRRHPGHHRRRLGRRPRSGAAGARGRGHGTLVLEDRDAARQAADVTAGSARCACSACPAIRSRPSSAPCCSWCR